MPAGYRYACRGGVARGVRDCTAGTSKSLWEFEREPIFLVEKSGQKWGCRSCPKMECVFALKVVDLDLILAKTGCRSVSSVFSPVQIDTQSSTDRHPFLAWMSILPSHVCMGAIDIRSCLLVRLEAVGGWNHEGGAEWMDFGWKFCFAVTVGGLVGFFADQKV